ncbi:hypothetical protein ATN84_12180 [Paramesorhizobium deserti]|uniref:Glycosyl transferase family 25 domain-containing protein n=1 Tax=Paramesorhizobium deserti TaxID=1494590 RepID=A0A135HUA7_9HYPH|nr:glycosyltransferase family 25 protein [Paramesorhizobium deserti]KXF76773.1 hypothetical protein ATN84_12180 [Paramesorhizobium deserti]
MKSYLINLDRSQDRLKLMTYAFSSLGIAFERVPAIDGAILTPELLKTVCANQSMSAGSIACFLSHRECWDRIANGDGDYGAIFEDDIHFSPVSRQFLGNDDWIPRDADIVKLESFNRKTLIAKKSHVEIDGHGVRRLYSIHLGASGYILSKACAKRLLAETTPITTSIDHVLFNPQHGKFQAMAVYQVVPSLCVQDQFISRSSLANALKTTIELAIPKRKGWSKLRRELVRPFEKIGILVRGLWINHFTQKQWGRIPFSLPEAMARADVEE